MNGWDDGAEKSPRVGQVEDYLYLGMLVGVHAGSDAETSTMVTLFGAAGRGAR